MMMTAGIDAARNIDMKPPEVAGEIGIAKSPRQFLRHRNRARIGQAAIVEPGASDDVGDQPDIGCCHADLIERPPERRKIALRDMRQDQVLFVPDADLAK